MSKLKIKILLLIVLLISIYYLDIFVVKSNTIKTQDENLVLEIKEEGLKLDIELNKMIYFGTNLGDIIINNIDAKNIANKEYIESLKNELIPQFTDTIKIFKGKSGWFVFNSNIIQGANTLDFVRMGDSYERQSEYDVVKSGYTKDSWWIESLNEEGYFSNPYYWKDWDSYIFSYSKGFYKEGKLIGVSGIEFSFVDFYELLKGSNILGKDIMILNENFEYIYNSNETFESPAFYGELRLMLKENIRNSNNGIFDFKFNKKKNTIAYYSLENNWKLLLKSNS
ncbi:MAG: hypothetical protein N4A54_03240 [Peptostreptococcaceae bacterium]|nr:hypothetical protein [Peptostreptococcaceae bacterium]